jgi:hypothetical protein
MHLECLNHVQEMRAIGSKIYQQTTWLQAVCVSIHIHFHLNIIHLNILIIYPTGFWA